MSHSARDPFAASDAPGVEDPRLTPARMAAYATGDFTVNAVLMSLNLFFVTYFLTQIAGLRPELAGMVQLVGRGVDAVTDPAMGRISDRCGWRRGRRRPFFLLGALPFGASFALLWLTPASSQTGMLLYYSAVYVLLSVSMTVVSVPYLALLPEMALGYDARTRLNVYRNVGSILGLSAAVAFRPVAQALGGGAAGFAGAAALYGIAIALPWLLVHAGSWERPEFQLRPSEMGLREALSRLARHHSFRRLTGIYLCSRISMDIVGAMLILFFVYVIGRSEDFELTMALFLAAVLVSLPFWLAVSSRFDKATLVAVGSGWWLASFAVVLAAQPDWPRWLLLSIAPLGAIGFAVVDLMVWSMLGDVVDEDDLDTGERREGIYNGAFMFLRKLGGSIAVALALGLLGLAGFDKDRVQTPQVLQAIRLLTGLGPALFLGLALWLARGYPLTRRRHAEIRRQLDARDGRG